MKNLIITIALLFIEFLFYGCAVPPKTEFNAAKAALEQAKAAQSDLYFESDFLAIQDSLNIVQTEIEAQSSKLFKSYSKSKEELVVIIDKVNALIAKSEFRKEEIKIEIATIEAATNALIEENNKLLADVPKGKSGKEAIEAIQSDLTNISNSITEVSRLVANGEYLSAKEKVNIAHQSATEINIELLDVRQKTIPQKVYKDTLYCIVELKDSDHDGLSDDIDQCPNIPGTKSNHGCPESNEKSFDSIFVDLLPEPSSYTELNSSRFLNCKTFKEIEKIISDELILNGFSRLRYFYTRDEKDSTTGFALVTQLEQISANGEPLSNESRWISETPNFTNGFSLKEYLRILIKGNPGFFRCFLFVVTSGNIIFQKTEVPTKEVAEGWSQSGLLYTSDEFNSKAIESAKLHYWVLIYHFKIDDISGESKLLVPSSIGIQDHFKNSTIWETLVKK